MLVIKSVIQSIAEVDRTLTLLNDGEVFSAYERHYCLQKRNPAPSFAGIWCVKLAFRQAIANVVDPGCSWADCEVRHAANGRPWLKLTDALTEWCQQRSILIDVSISHSGEFAAATVLLYSNTTAQRPPKPAKGHRLAVPQSERMVEKVDG